MTILTEATIPAWCCLKFGGHMFQPLPMGSIPFHTLAVNEVILGDL